MREITYEESVDRVVTGYIWSTDNEMIITFDSTAPNVGTFTVFKAEINYHRQRAELRSTLFEPANWCDNDLLEGNIFSKEELQKIRNIAADRYGS